MTQAKTKQRCSVCAHPLRKHIDVWFKDHTIRAIQGLVEESQPEKPLSVRALHNHKTNHWKPPVKVNDELEAPLLSLTGLAPEVVKQLADSAPTPEEFLKAVLNIGLQNVVNNPKKVSVAQAVLASIELRKGTAAGDDDFEDFFKAVYTATKGKRKPRQLTQVVADDVVLPTGEEIEGEYDFGEESTESDQ